MNKVTADEMRAVPQSRVMSIDFLFDDFDRLIQSPESVHRLRRFILDLAVRGKLVPQDPNDEPASELLKRITAEKARLVKAGKIKKNKAKPIQMANEPFKLPASWEWAAIGDVFLYDAGTKREPTVLDQKQWLLELEDIEKDSGRLLVRTRVCERESRSTKSEFHVGDILYGKLRPYLNKVLVADKPGYSTTEIVALRSHLPLRSEYCALALRRPDFVDYVTRLGQGTKMPRLRTEDAMISPFPLPPLAEQHRIVAKVDELMALCDRLEAARAEREATRDRLATVSLARLNAPDPDPTRFQHDVAFALNNLTPLTTRPDQIKALRQTILNLAVRGKLVEQDSEDEAVIKQHSGKPKCEGLPANWRRLRLEEFLSENTRNGYSRKPDDAHDGIPMLRISAGTTRIDELVAEEEHKLISGVGPDIRAKYSLKSGDLLACRFNGNKKFVGRMKLFKDYLGIQPIYPDKLIRVRVDACKALPEFVRIAAESDRVRQQVETFCSTTVGNWGISASNLRKMLFPLPPRAEQRLIVAKVDELMFLCDQLEKSLVTGDDTCWRLLNARLHKALKPNGSRRELAC